MNVSKGTDARIAVTGDAIITRQLSTCNDAQLHEVLEPIRDAHVSFTNLEVLLHDYEGYPAANSGGTYMRAPPWVADELTWAGFDCVAAATNHVGDYSHEGMERTMQILEDRAIPYAGLGRTLSEARKPAYCETEAGRTAVVAACSTITPGTEAGRQRPDMQGRPGLSPLHLKTTYVVPEEIHAIVTELSEELGLEAIKKRREELGFPIPGDDRSGFTLPNLDGEANLHFKIGDEFAIERQVNQNDAEEILDQIRYSSQQADWVIASHHIHEGRDGFFNDDSVPKCLEEFAHDCINAGADLFVGHGPHMMRGIELYQGAPIFYSLGDFLMQNETVSRLPAEIYERYDLDPYTAEPAELFDKRVSDEDGRIGFLSDSRFWETVVPVCEFEGNRIKQITLYPAELGFEKPRSQRGRPALATGEHADSILNQIATLSTPYSTEIEIVDGIGTIEF